MRSSKLVVYSGRNERLVKPILDLFSFSTGIELEEFGATTVLVTHDQEEALSMASLVALMRDGRVVQTAEPVLLYQYPTDLWAARFVGDTNVLRGAVTETGLASCSLGRIPLRANHTTDGGPAFIMLRPEQLRLSPAGLDSGGRPRAIVRAQTFRGHESLVRLHLLGSPDQELVARVPGQALPAVGSEVLLEVNGDAIAFPVSPDLAL